MVGIMKTKHIHLLIILLLFCIINNSIVRETLANRPINDKIENPPIPTSPSYTLIKNDLKWDQITGNGNISFIFNLNSYLYKDGIYSFNCCLFTTQEGFPLLPFVSERFILPLNASIKDVLVTEAENEYLTPPLLRIFISQPKSSPKRLFDLATYNITYDIFPKRVVQVGGSPVPEYGINIQHLLIFPFQAYGNGSVVVHRKINITISFFAEYKGKEIRSYPEFLENVKTVCEKIWNITNVE
jgi:hypothetical protein